MPITTPDAVKRYTGVVSTDLEFATEPEYDTWLNERIAEVEDLIETDLERTFDGEWPVGLRRIANDMMRNMVTIAITTRGTPVARIDDWNIRITEPDIYTSSIAKALKRYKSKPKLRLTTIHKDTVTDADEEQV